MGLFDPLAVGIRKKVPPRILAQFDNVIYLANRDVPARFSLKQRGLIVGCVAAAWLLGEHRAGRIDLDDRSGKYVSNMGNTCGFMLRGEQNAVADLIDHLVEEGFIAPL